MFQEAFNDSTGAVPVANVAAVTYLVLNIFNFYFVCACVCTYLSVCVLCPWRQNMALEPLESGG